MTNERLAELIPHIESALEDGYPLQLKGDDLRFLLEAIKARLSHEPSVRMKTGKPSIESCEHDWRDHPTFLAWQSCSRCTLFRRVAQRTNDAPL